MTKSPLNQTKKIKNIRQAKKAVRKGMTPDKAGNLLGGGENFDKLINSRAYKKQRADEAGYKNIRQAKKAAKANDGVLPYSPLNQTTASVRDEELRSAHLSNAEEKYYADYTPEKLEEKYYDKLDASKPRSPREMRKFRRQGKKSTDLMRKAERKANRELNR
jgi:hypothetical protein